MTSRLRYASVALAVLAVTLVAVGTGGYSAVTADRSISVTVADDSTAVLGLERDLVAGTNNSTASSVTVTNRLVTDVTVQVDPEPIGDDRPSLDVDPGSFTLAPGDDREVRVSMACPGPNATSMDEAGADDAGNETVDDGSSDLEDVDLDVHARGSNVEIELTRSVTVGCAPVDSTD